jgi:hypothetical protein
MKEYEKKELGLVTSVQLGKETRKGLFKDSFACDFEEFSTVKCMCVKILYNS